MNENYLLINFHNPSAFHAAIAYCEKEELIYECANLLIDQYQLKFYSNQTKIQVQNFLGLDEN